MNFFERKFYRFYVSYLQNSEGNDLKYLKAQYYLKNGTHIDFDSPKEFMEKIQWLKLNKYTEEYKDYVDKYEVRKFVEERVGKHILNEVYEVYDSAEEIELSKLPNQFVLKCTHASGTNIIVKDKSKLNWTNAKALLNKWMKINYYYKSRERIYKDIKPRIIAEKYLNQFDEGSVVDYKFYCIHGKPTYILTKLEEGGKNYKCFYTLDWEKVMPEKEYPFFLKKDLPKPSNLEEMLSIAEKLSDGLIFNRIDLYSIQGKTIFGEMTFFPTGGIKRIFVERLNKELGDLIKLPTDKLH